MRALDHDLHMRTALALAEQARLICPPNPAVGCVIVGRDGEVLGQGHTQPVGQAHAEIMALRDAAARGLPVQDATAYVTLEPCAHQGRTGPCCDALVAAGIARVVASIEDHNPRVAGQGLARLKAADVEVLVGPGAEAPPCPTGAASGSPRQPHAPTATRGVHGPVPCSPASARCWKTTRN